VPRFLRDTRGGNFVEYIVIVGLVALVALSAWKKFGRAILSVTQTEAHEVALLESGASDGCLQGLCINGNCFVAGTLVATSTGMRPIESLAAGDLVESRLGGSDETRLEPIVRTFATPDEALVDVHLVESAEPIRCTPGHLFRTADRGWIEAQSLAPSEPLVARGGAELHVASVAALGEHATVYNLEVAETHTYFAGAAGALVHNPTGPCGGGGGGGVGGVTPASGDPSGPIILPSGDPGGGGSGGSGSGGDSTGSASGSGGGGGSSGSGSASSSGGSSGSSSGSTAPTVLNGSSPGAATSGAGTVFSNNSSATPATIPPGATAVANLNPGGTPPVSGTTKIGKTTKQTFTEGGSTYIGGDTYKNKGGELPTKTASGAPITYTEWDTNPYTPGVNRGSSRVVIGSDGREYYTGDHYKSFTQMN
jgi:Flp pilus assembly pilin Flp/guanyl-specific ribonuclease Sa